MKLLLDLNSNGSCILNSQMLKITFGATRGSLGSNGSWIFADLNVQKILLEQLLDVLDLMDQKLGSIGSYLPMNTFGSNGIPDKKVPFSIM